MKTNRIIFLFLAGLAILMLSGCVTAGIMKPEVPMSEQCVLILPDSSFMTITYDDMVIPRYASEHNAVVPAGRHKVLVTYDFRHIVDQKTSGNYITTWFYECREIFSGEYNFDPGKTYEVNIRGAGVRHEGDQIFVADNSNVNTRWDGKLFVIEHSEGHGLAIYDQNVKNMGTAYTGKFGISGIEVAAWDCGPALVGAIGPRIGYQVIKNKFGFIANGEIMVYAGLAYRDFDYFGAPLGFTFAGMTRYVFPNVGFGLGGGLTMGYYAGDNDKEFSEAAYLFPYAEFNATAGKNLLHILGKSYSVYVRYFFRNTKDWYNKFGVGLRIN